VVDFPATAAEAQRRLSRFHKWRHPHYQSQRNRLDLQGTSQISPYLRFGLISAREAFAQAHIASSRPKPDAERGEIKPGWMSWSGVSSTPPFCIITPGY
jgi:deoxyribodipyrimidine photo-lyase